MTDRALGAPLAAEIQQGLVRPAILFEGEFSSGWLRCWTGVGTLAWNGQTWLGTGLLGTVGAVTESTEIKASGITVGFAGIPSSMLAVALGACRQGMVGRLYLALLDAAGQIVGTPYLAFSGRCDVPVIEDGAQSGTIAITYESRLIDLDRARERRYTDQDQQSEYAGDLGFAFVASIADLAFPVGVAQEGRW